MPGSSGRGPRRDRVAGWRDAWKESTPGEKVQEEGITGSVPGDPGNEVPEERRWVLFPIARKKELLALDLEEGSRRGDVGPVPGERRRRRRIKRPRKSAACLRICSLERLQSPGEEVVFTTTMWVGFGVTQPLCSSPQLGSMQPCKTSYCCSSYD